LILLADSLLDENGPERGKKFLDKKLCGLEQIIESAIELHSIKIKEKKIKLDFIRPKEKIEAFLDKEKISIAIQNILDNAVKYTGQGGKITIYLEKSGNNLQLKIQDSGIGILEKEKKNMFAKFFRGANVPKANGGDGSGLGLFIAKNIIEAHEGKIWFESKENVGSTFYISLPLKI